MRKILTGILVLMQLNAFAQATDEEAKTYAMLLPTVEKVRAFYPNACHVYKSAADYYNNKPIENMDWESWNSSPSKIQLIKNGTAEKVKRSELGDVWFSDKMGFLMRPDGKKLYRVVVDGPICYYVEFDNGEVYKDNDSIFSFNTSSFSDKYFDYYSMTLTGEIESWSQKMFETHLEEYNLLEAYKADKPKREMKDSVWDFESKKLNKRLKYMRLVNQKMAAK